MKSRPADRSGLLLNPTGLRKGDEIDLATMVVGGPRTVTRDVLAQSASKLGYFRVLALDESVVVERSESGWELDDPHCA
jgi:hypothetical protein